MESSRPSESETQSETGERHLKFEGRRACEVQALHEQEFTPRTILGITPALRPLQRATKKTATTTTTIVLQCIMLSVEKAGTYTESFKI